MLSDYLSNLAETFEKIRDGKLAVLDPKIFCGQVVECLRECQRGARELENPVHIVFDTDKAEELRLSLEEALQ